MRERWDDVRVKVIRPGPVDQRGVCANSIPQEDLKATNLPQGQLGSWVMDQGGTAPGMIALFNETPP